MKEEDIKELMIYFKLSKYRDDGELLLDEYEELESIIKRNKIVKYLEEIRYLNIIGKLSDVKYQELLNIYDVEIENYMNKNVLIKRKKE